MSLNSGGIALARIETRAQGAPSLTVCEFREASRDERGGIIAVLSREYQLGAARCVSVMAGEDFTLLQVEMPPVEASEVRAAVRWRIRELIDFHIDDAVIDVFDILGQQDRGRPNLLYAVAARANLVKQHIALLEDNGVGLEVIDIPELCQRNVAALLPEDRNGVAFLHLGRRNGLLTLSRQGTLYLSRLLDVGTDQMVSADNSFDAESLRQFDNIVLEVQRSLDYYESHFSLPPISALVLAPMEQPVPGMLGHIAGSLGIPVRVLDLNAVLEMERPLDDALQSRCLSAIGAALRREEKAL